MKKPATIETKLQQTPNFREGWLWLQELD